MHLPSKPAFCEALRGIIINAMEKTKTPYHPTGTTVTIEGPRFSTLAESHLFSRVFGAEIVNMTTCPEGIGQKGTFL
jgi:5'-methylthioadenosine phosphorylase